MAISGWTNSSSPAPAWEAAGVGRGEDAGGAQEFGAACRLLAAHGGQLGDQAHRDAGAEDGGGPGEPGGFEAQVVEAGDKSAAACGAVELAQFGGRVLDGREAAVLDLGEEFDGLVRVAVGDRPHLAAERAVGVRAEGGAGEAGGGLRGEGLQDGDRRARGGGDRVQVAGALTADLAGPAGDHDQDGQVVEAFGERGEPAQGLLVGPVGVVDQQDQRPVALGESAHRGDQSVADALRVGLPLAGFGDAEGGARDVVPVAEVLAGLLGHQRDEGGLQQLPYDVEGDGLEGLAAAGLPDHALACLGHAAGLGEEGGLAEAGLAADHQQAARGGPVRAERVERLRHTGDRVLALPQGGRGGLRRPFLRHPVTSPVARTTYSP